MKELKVIPIINITYPEQFQLPYTSRIEDKDAVII